MNRKFGFFGVALTAAMLTALGMPSPASAAASPNSIQIPASLVTAGLPHPTIAASLVPQFSVGDCSIVGDNQSYVSVDLTTGDVSIRAESRTSHTNDADVFHSDLAFYDANGTRVLAVGGAQLDSPPMSLINQNYGWVRTVHVGQLPSSTAGVTSVVWTGRC